jgi:hypothetical protein
MGGLNRDRLRAAQAARRHAQARRARLIHGDGRSVRDPGESTQ